MVLVLRSMGTFADRLDGIHMEGGSGFLLAIAPTASTGKITPVSLLAYMVVTRAVLPVTAASTSIRSS